jgi:hypothetical protein
MISKSFPWGKIFLSIGLLLVAIEGVFLNPLIRKHFSAVEDARVARLNSAKEAYLKIEERLNVYRIILNDINILYDTVHAGSGRQKMDLNALAFPLSQLGARVSPGLSLKIQLRLAQKERVNVERKMERLSIMLDSIEREMNLTPGHLNTEALPFEAQQAKTLQQVEMIRQHLLMAKADLGELSENLTIVDKSQNE